jgi:hypothetical protein
VVIDDVEDLLNAASDERDMVWLWRKGGSTWGFLESLTPLSLRDAGIRATVRQRCGGGYFRARLRQRGGAWGASREFSIEGEPKAPPRDDPGAAVGASVTAPAASTSSSTTADLMRTIAVPVLSAIGAGVAAALVKRFADGPQTDPILLKLLERVGRGDGETINALELQRLILESEKRGEDRGRQIGELTAQLDAPASGGADAGVIGAVKAAVPTINRMLDLASGERRERRRLLVATESPSPSPAAAAPPASDPPASAPVPDIVPTWIRPFLRYKPLLISVADRGKSAAQYADLIMDQIEDSEPLLTAVVDANTAGRLLDDLKAAIPEIAGHPAREKFATELVTAMQESLAEMAVDESPADDAPAPTGEASHG